MSKAPRVFVFCNAGADDHIEAGPFTVAEARRYIAGQDDEQGRIAYWTRPASRVSPEEFMEAMDRQEEAAETRRILAAVEADH